MQDSVAHYPPYEISTFPFWQVLLISFWLGERVARWMEFCDIAKSSKICLSFSRNLGLHPRQSLLAQPLRQFLPCPLLDCNINH